MCISIFYCFVCFSLHLYIYFQNTQNGSDQSAGAAVYQQGAAVTYSQEGLEHTGSDGTTFKAQADTRAAALPSAGPSLNGAYTPGAAPG